MPIATNAQLIAGLYVAVFNRAPDPAGLAYWQNAINSGVTFSGVAASFAAHPVFASTYGSLSDAQFVSAIYQNVLGAAGDAQGVAYWTAKAASGVSRAEIAAEFIQGSLTADIGSFTGLTQAERAAAQVRQDSLTHKVDVGLFYAGAVGASGNMSATTDVTTKEGLESDQAYVAAQVVLNDVNASTASVDTAKAYVTAAVSTANPITTLLGTTQPLVLTLESGYGDAATFNRIALKTGGLTIVGLKELSGDAMAITTFNNTEESGRAITQITNYDVKLNNALVSAFTLETIRKSIGTGHITTSNPDGLQIVALQGNVSGTSSADHFKFWTTNPFNDVIYIHDFNYNDTIDLSDISTSTVSASAGGNNLTVQNYFLKASQDIAVTNTAAVAAEFNLAGSSNWVVDHAEFVIASFGHTAVYQFKNNLTDHNPAVTVDEIKLMGVIDNELISLGQGVFGINVV